MTAEVSAKLLLPFSDDLCLVGIHCSVGLAHKNGGKKRSSEILGVARGQSPRYGFAVIRR